MNHEIRFLVPQGVWEHEGLFAAWLWRREISGFFWEVCHYADYVVIEAID